MSFTAHIKEALDSGDPLVRKWFMVENNYLPFVLCALYVFFVKRLGPDLMKNRKPFDLRSVMIVYNFSIVCVYIYCLYGLIHVLTTTDAIKYVCSPFDLKNNPDHFTYKAATLCWIICIVKYAEFADTVFFVLRKKNNLITNLHVIHHASLPIIGWIFLRTERNAFQVVPGVINSFVHVIMYTYYGLAAIGPEVQKHLWWKKHLTKLQMVSFLPSKYCNLQHTFVF
ncbi:elongation of very long chain fatty acids protein 7-like [Stegodyphus dumicola]|uniref:elongation of very long chain fatty acids protein 7-like n=1 Tax=Stegodyphus dumicola TaxID=202533 RepID=UPI0015AE38E9|nr:elongation of very long chain fatty acids protein 7-like [Stegodyphus dumicola]XP_035212847.1 elongation of very long chain fatty acids protein 7-like [Stegodyphus dumicola]XP_035212848.1 elongation of very long chain fatty acids protein 7-like [Stegodyphus dumicola]XP_035212849.1 elongation of very long chain fatty acids protein 7-like [Stegodyphus dumicola]XP_035212850.1 elongation of very long chain fatty acids protein 7-like [Stegodyphus dumicola]